jgi:hypothetical protein
VICNKENKEPKMIKSANSSERHLQNYLWPKRAAAAAAAAAAVAGAPEAFCSTVPLWPLMSSSVNDKRRPDRLQK